jgi:hypothetical protein
MKNKKFCLGMLAMVLVFGIVLIGCDDGRGGDPIPPYVPPEPTPLTGTVTVTSNITFSSGVETMTLTADISDLNGTSDYSYSYQWIREGTNITTNARSKTYVVTEADYGKALSVKITYSGFSGEQSGNFTVPSPTTMSLTLKWANDAGKKTHI